LKHPLISALEARDRLSAAERDILLTMAARERSVPAKEDIVREGTRPQDSCLVLSGLSARYHILADGRRQITAIHVRGDFVDLHSLLLGTMDHGVVALTDCRVAFVPHAVLRDITETQPHLTRLLWLLTLIDAAIHRRWIVAAGRLQAPGQLAHLICELYTRLDLVGAASNLSFEFPVSQVELSDALGLSSVHVNRTLRELRDRGLITWENSQVTITNWAGLKACAEFDPTYLNLQQTPR
jgi:CRP-like cAMP-binding protein